MECYYERYDATHYYYAYLNEHYYAYLYAHYYAYLYAHGYKKENSFSNSFGKHFYQTIFLKKRV